MSELYAEKAKQEQKEDLETLEHLNIALTRKLFLKYGATIIDISKVPERRGRSDWFELFNAIPKGKAVMMPKSYLAVHGFLSKQKSKGRFKDYYVTIQGGRTYIVHRIEKVGKAERKTP